MSSAHQMRNGSEDVPGSSGDRRPLTLFSVHSFISPPLPSLDLHLCSRIRRADCQPRCWMTPTTASVRLEDSGRGGMFAFPMEVGDSCLFPHVEWQHGIRSLRRIISTITNIRRYETVESNLVAGGLRRRRIPGFCGVAPCKLVHRIFRPFFPITFILFVHIDDVMNTLGLCGVRMALLCASCCGSLVAKHQRGSRISLLLFIDLRRILAQSIFFRACECE